MEAICLGFGLSYITFIGGVFLLGDQALCIRWYIVSYITDDEVDPFVLPDRPTLPPDDIDFSTLYVFKKDLETFSVQENFISLSSTFKRKEESNTAAHRTSHHKKLRYMDTQIGEVKNNPARKNKSQKKKGLKNKW